MKSSIDLEEFCKKESSAAASLFAKSLNNSQGVALAPPLNKIGDKEQSDSLPIPQDRLAFVLQIIS